MIVTKEYRIDVASHDQSFDDAMRKTILIIQSDRNAFISLLDDSKIVTIITVIVKAINILGIQSKIAYRMATFFKVVSLLFA